MRRPTRRFRAPGGKTEKIVCLVKDITARKQNELSNLRKRTGFDNSSIAMMTVDRDFIVTDVNQATKDLMERSAAVFGEIWPDFDPASIIGQSIDQFHKKPAHQRKMLADPANLPFKTDITIGAFKFALNVDGIFDEKGRLCRQHPGMGGCDRGPHEFRGAGGARPGAGDHRVHAGWGDHGREQEDAAAYRLPAR